MTSAVAVVNLDLNNLVPALMNMNQQLYGLQPIQLSIMDDQNMLDLQNLHGKKDPDINHSFKQIVEENGFEFSSHQVTTDDGYILNVFRIQNPGVTKSGAPVVFLQHGIVDSADCWIMNYNEVAPAF